MTPQDFSESIRRVQDIDALRLGLDWITTLEAGGTIPRLELELQYSVLLYPLMQLQPLDVKQAYASADGSYSYDPTALLNPQSGVAIEGGNPALLAQPNGVQQPAQQAQQTQPAQQQAAAYTPPVLAYKQDPQAQKLTLGLYVGSTTAKVGDPLSFELSANEACELQVLYVESTGNVEEIPAAMIGSTTLQPGERRQIPQPGSGSITFDSPAPAETMIAFCRVGGLGDKRMTAEDARRLVAQSNQPATKGIAINLAKKAEADNGASTLNMVTFDVK